LGGSNESGAKGGALGDSPDASPMPVTPADPADPELAAVVEAWPDLTAAVRAGIVAIVTAASHTTRSTDAR